MKNWRSSTCWDKSNQYWKQLGKIQILSMSQKMYQEPQDSNQDHPAIREHEKTSDQINTLHRTMQMADKDRNLNKNRNGRECDRLQCYMKIKIKECASSMPNQTFFAF